ncbi:hypothetical protein T12_634 [Trichinella patagoniensis]|uniref:Uncharacterized protein n=1 Tax=Trichinella patagoniensis TaxID=990121 RepID=A0A0V1AB25_9BILA|nr:hypothetical protein T12_634 [Trichinella patagoniensis]
MKHAVSKNAALNQVLTHKFFGISQEIRNHERVSPKELVFKLGDNMDISLVYLKKYAITNGPDSFIILSE